MHEYLFDKAVIDRIILREMMAAVFCGKGVKVNGLLAVYLNIRRQPLAPFIKCTFGNLVLLK